MNQVNYTSWVPIRDELRLTDHGGPGGASESLALREKYRGMRTAELQALDGKLWGRNEAIAVLKEAACRGLLDATGQARLKALLSENEEKRLRLRWPSGGPEPGTPLDRNADLFPESEPMRLWKKYFERRPETLSPLQRAIWAGKVTGPIRSRADWRRMNEQVQGTGGWGNI